MRIKSKIFYLLFILLSFNSNSYAEVEVISDLNFGELAVPYPGSVSSINLSQSGHITISGKIYILTTGNIGEYRFYNLTPGTTVEFEPSSDPEKIYPSDVVLQNDAAFDFIVDTTKITRVIPQSGETNIKIGGTLKTTGLGKVYKDSNYNGFFVLNITTIY